MQDISLESDQNNLNAMNDLKEVLRKTDLFLSRNFFLLFFLGKFRNICKNMSIFEALDGITFFSGYVLEPNQT